MAIERQYHSDCISIGAFKMGTGEVLPDVSIAYEAVGQLSPAKDNVILICHALTGDAYAVGNQERSGWWSGLIGAGRRIDTNRYYVITTNVLGGCGGTTGPASLNPATGRPYGSSFPLVTIRDMVRAQRQFLEVLGINHLYAVIGGSMGGMQVFEWGVMYPDFMDHLIPIATSTRLSGVAIAYNDVGRQAILADPGYQDGHYYPGPGPAKGLSIARMVGMITYRTAELFEMRFGRNIKDDQDQPFNANTVFQIESYLRYQGEKLVDRFDANSYLYLLKAMDFHDISRGRGSTRDALSLIKSKMLMIGIEGDLLYPTDHLREVYEELRRLGQDVQFATFPSIFGHDAFLVEFDAVGELIDTFLNKTNM